MTSTPALQLEQLTVVERLELIERLWDSIPVDDLAIPESHRKELDRRLESADANLEAAIAWEQVRDKLRRHS